MNNVMDVLVSIKNKEKKRKKNNKKREKKRGNLALLSDRYIAPM